MSSFPRKFQYLAIWVICDKVVSRGPPEKRKRFRVNRVLHPTVHDLSLVIVLFDNIQLWKIYLKWTMTKVERCQVNFNTQLLTRPTPWHRSTGWFRDVWPLLPGYYHFHLLTILVWDITNTVRYQMNKY